jgi:ABC-2 type transport system permease protein
MLRFLIEKEFKQIFRHSFMPRIIFIMPTIMLLVLPWAANQDIKDMNLSVVDNDHSDYSTRLVNKVVSSGYFRLTDVSASNEEALQSVAAGKADVILEIQPEFEKELIKTGVARIMISVNSVNGVKGGLGSQYMINIIRDYSQDLLTESGLVGKKATMMQAAIVPYSRFNPHLDYKVYIVPALMVILLTMLCGFLPALNIAGEKEVGTIEQMNVTPVSKLMFIVAKLIPYWIIGYIVLSIGLTLALLIYGLTPAGSLATIYLYATIYVLTVSGLGLVISNYSNTMQQAQFVIAFFVILLIMMSGLFFPINSMPEAAQVATLFNPLRHFMEVMRAVYLKGSSMTDLLPQFFALCGFAVVLNGWAVLSYRKKGA